MGCDVGHGRFRRDRAMTIGMRVRLTEVGRKAWGYCEFMDRIGTISDGNDRMMAIDFDGLDYRVWLPASNVEEVTNG